MSRVALLLGDPARLRPVARAIVGAGGRTAAAEDAAASSASWVLALVDDVDEATRADLRALAAQRPGSSLTLVLGAALPPEGWRALTATPQVTQALALEGPWLSELLLTASCGATELDMVGRCLAAGAQVERHTLTRSSDKGPTLARVDSWLAGFAFGARLRGRVLDVADELVMNALYDAPTRPDGSPRHASAPRTQPVELADAEAVTLSVACDGRTLAVSMRDPFGALDAATVRRSLERGLAGGDAQIERKAGGAGLGLYLMWSTLGALIVRVRPGRSTEVTGLLDVRGGGRDVVATPKSLLMITV